MLDVEGLAKQQPGDFCTQTTAAWEVSSQLKRKISPRQTDKYSIKSPILGSHVAIFEIPAMGIVARMQRVLLHALCLAVDAPWLPSTSELARFHDRLHWSKRLWSQFCRLISDRVAIKGPTGTVICFIVIGTRWGTAINLRTVCVTSELSDKRRSMPGFAYMRCFRPSNAVDNRDHLVFREAKALR